MYPFLSKKKRIYPSEEKNQFCQKISIKNSANKEKGTKITMNGYPQQLTSRQDQ